MKRLRVMIVEDQKLLRMLWDKALVEVLFEKRFAVDGEAALQLYKSWKPELILLDVILPIMTGYQVLKEIREEMGDLATPIVMETSLSEKDDILECLKLGISGYIVKPFNLKEVPGKIIQYVSSAYPAWAEEAAAALSSNSKSPGV
ncbi:MAG: response regulator [Pseudomonadota bacterium]